MLDIKFLRANPDVVKENIKKKFQDQKLPLVDEAIELDIKKLLLSTSNAPFESTSGQKDIV